MEVWSTATIGLLLLVLILAVLGVAAAIMKKKKKKKKKKRASESKSNVIYLSKKRIANENSDDGVPRSQKCSRCNQAKKLVFYSNDFGHVAGLCKECRKEIGDKQGLYPI